MRREVSIAGIAVWIAVLVTGAVAQERVPPIVLLTPTEAYDPVRFEAGFMVADAWRELGLDVTIAPTDFRELIARVYNEQDFDAAMLGWSGRVDRLDPTFFLGTLDSRQSGLMGNNAGGYSNPEFDALYDAQSRAFEPEDRVALVKAAQAVYAREAPLSVLFYRDEIVAHNHTTFGNLLVTAGDGLYSEWNLMHARPLTARQRLQVAGPQGPDTLNPLASTSVWGWKWMRMYYDTLLRLSPDAEPVMWAAHDVDAIDDHTIEAYLREGMTFHDGTPVTAHDVAFTFGYYSAQAYAYFNAYLAPLESVEAIDDLTVRFHLNKPSASFATVALSQIPILPRHIWEGIEAPGDLASDEIPVIGSGPFTFGAHDPGKGMWLDKSPEHFYAPHVQVSGVDFRIYPDMNGVLAALIAGEADITAWQFDATQIPVAEGVAHLTVVSAPDYGFQHLTFNARRHAFADPGFRRALSFAIDRERIVNALLEGRAEIGSSIIAPVNAFWHNPDIERFDYDMTAAFAELEAAGYTWDAEARLLLP